MKGLSPFLSGVLYMAIVVSTIILVVNVITPAIEEMKDKASFEQAVSTMSIIDKAIQEVMSEGKFSSRVITISVDRGKYIIDNSSNRIEYILETEADLVSPGVKKRIGNLIITSGMDVDVFVVNDTIVMRNSYLEVNFTKLGNQTNMVPINLSEIIENVTVIKENVTIKPNMTIKVSGVESGNGYVIPQEVGEELSKGVVIAHVETNAIRFDVYFTLNSYADFIAVDVRNLEVVS